MPDREGQIYGVSKFANDHGVHYPAAGSRARSRSFVKSYPGPALATRSFDDRPQIVVAANNFEACPQSGIQPQLQQISKIILY
jgi:hypothetical protein